MPSSTTTTSSWGLPRVDFTQAAASAMLAATSTSVISHTLAEIIHLDLSNVNHDSRLALLVELYTSAVEACKAQALSAGKLTIVLQLTQRLLLECEERGWPEAHAAQKLWDALMYEHTSSSTHTRVVVNEEREVTSSSSRNNGTTSVEEGATETTAHNEHVVEAATHQTQQQQQQQQITTLRASEGRNVTEWSEAHSLLRHYDMYRIAFTTDAPRKPIQLVLHVETPMIPPALLSATLEQEFEHHP